MHIVHATATASQRTVCIYCAFAARKQWLKSLRHRSSSIATNLIQTRANVTTSRIRRLRSDEPPSSSAAIARKRQYELRGSRSDWPDTKPSASRRRTQRREADQPYSPSPSTSWRYDPGNFKARKYDATSAGKPPWMQHGQRRLEQTFESKLRLYLKEVREELKESPIIQALAKEAEESPEDWFERLWTRYVNTLERFDSEGRAAEPLPNGRNAADVLGTLRTVHTEKGSVVLKQHIRWEFLDTILMPRFNESNRKSHKEIGDVRYIGEWYPEARQTKRKFYMHVGPTNSGKTYQALQRLLAAKGGGCFAGPLRLLAHETYARLNAAGVPCWMATGEERRAPTIEHDPLSRTKTISCTVEMVPLNAKMDVCVIDEIQMISDPERGWAWTQAVLGVTAKEVHLCGEERAVPLLQSICASLGEELVVNRYERLTPLKPAKQSLHGDFSGLRKGDCVVSFSVVSIHALKKMIEEQTKHRVAVVYGSLPAETRAQQAELFNDPNNDYDVLVASDAIGMGLNLAIKRIIFETVVKFNGVTHSVLDVAHIKQISGRAGRYRTAYQARQKDEESSSSTSTGLVTALQDYDLPIIEKALATTPVPLSKAGMIPAVDMVERFAAYFPPETPFSYIIHKLWNLVRTDKRYFICQPKEVHWLADVIQSIPMSVRERYAFCALPAGGGREQKAAWREIIMAFARTISEQKPLLLPDMEELPLEVLDHDLPTTDKAKKVHLQTLEMLHGNLISYMWLSFRFAGLFPHRALAKHTSELAQVKIAEALSSYTYEQGRAEVAARHKRAEQALKKAEMAAMADESAEQDKAESLELSADTDRDELGLDELEDSGRDVDDAGSSSTSDDGLQSLPHGDEVSSSHKREGTAGSPDEAFEASPTTTSQETDFQSQQQEITEHYEQHEHDRELAQPEQDADGRSVDLHMEEQPRQASESRL